MLISGIMITRGRFTLGGLFAFLAYFDLINGPAVDIVQEYIAFVKNVPVYTRISELLTLPNEYPTNEVEELIFSHQVALSDATFYYDKSTMILDKQSIIFERGHIYLVNGPSGSGKTTMAMLLLGISRLKEGSVIYDGREMREHNIESIRDQCAYVEQEPMMLHDTVYHNIRIGNLRAESDQVLQAAKKAHVDDFVKNLPAGYETKLGENGISLSTGQKRRIAIARCILREPKLIILDEPVSSVDPESESLIYKSIMDLADKMIVIIISHKFETNKLADIIVTLNDSKLTINMNK
jgi:ATP-binding cassette subfamily B protein